MVNWTLVTSVIGGVLAISGVLLGWGIFPKAVHEKIIENVRLEEGTEQFKRWQKTPQAIDFKVHIFNVTNPNEVQQGGKPIVKEIGPFVYSLYRQKDNIRFSRNKAKISFTNQQNYFFNTEASAPLTEDDPITVLNMHMNTVLQVAEDESYSNLNFVNNEINRVFGRPDSMFLRTTPREFLFEGVPFCVKATGIAKAICDSIKKKKTRTLREMPDGSLRFSFFHYKNTTDDGFFTINSGLRDSTSTMMIEAWEGKDFVSFWKNDTGERTDEPTVCNMINGTDASGFPPFVKKSGSMFIYSADICRSVEIFYEKEVEYQGITGYRYITKDNFLNEIGPEYDNDCFCVNRIKKGIIKENGCMYRGALDLSTCTQAPVVLTLPHMMGAAKEYTKLIEGMNPDPEKHQIFADVEPNTGLPLRGGKRVQFNMFLRKVDNIRLTDRLQTTLFPVIWVEESVELNEENIQLLYTMLINVLKLLDIIQWSLIAIGLILMVTMLSLYLYRRKKAKTVVEPSPASRFNIEQVREMPVIEPQQILQNAKG